MSIGAKRRYAAAAFITLLILSVYWPSPVVASNVLWIGADLDIDHLSFLGRQDPAWDVVFWFIAGLLLLMIVQSADPRAEPADALQQWRDARFDRALWRRAALRLGIGAVATAFVWLVLDQPVIAWVEAVESETTRSVIRIINRLGGGMNPVMIVLFYLIAGTAYLQRRWVSYAIAMGISGLTAGIIAQIIKYTVGRARPELWLGSMHYAPGASTSFPSGHTVGAFALAGVLMLGSTNPLLRIAAFIIAAGVGLSRILAFRHWPSDVVASAVIGLVTAWIATTAVVPREFSVVHGNERRRAT